MSSSLFYLTGKLEPTHTGRSFKVYTLDNGQWVFIGLVTRKALFSLLSREIPTANICKFTEPTKQAPLELKP
jgi:hypothetical protein